MTNNKQIRQLIKQMVKDGVRPPYDFEITADEDTYLQEADKKNNMTDEQRDHIDELLTYAIQEGTVAPEDIENWTDVEKLAWYKKQLAIEAEEGIEEDDLPF